MRLALKVLLFISASLPLFAQGLPAPAYRVHIFNISVTDYPPDGFLPQSAAGINNAGQIVGFWDAEEDCDICGKFEPNYGFIRDFIGKITQINDPRQGPLWAQRQDEGTRVTGINNKGEIVGTLTGALIPGSPIHSFSKGSGSGHYSSRDLANGTDTALLGINRSGWTVGFSDNTPFFSTAPGVTTNFVCGTFPGAQLVALNDNGIAVGHEGPVGMWVDLHQPQICHPMVVVPASINNKGQVVGMANDFRGPHPVLGSIANDTYYDLNLQPFPLGAIYTVNGLNDNGEITGTFYDPDPNLLGGPIGTELFVAAPVAQNTNVVISNTSWKFDPHTLGTSSGPAHFYLTNRGPQPALINGIELDNWNFWISSNTCPHIMKPWSTCEVRVVFSPFLLGPQTTTLTVSTNGANPTPGAVITGTGL